MVRDAIVCVLRSLWHAVEAVAHIFGIASACTSLWNAMAGACSALWRCLKSIVPRRDGTSSSSSYGMDTEQAADVESGRRRSIIGLVTSNRVSWDSRGDYQSLQQRAEAEEKVRTSAADKSSAVTAINNSEDGGGVAASVAAAKSSSQLSKSVVHV